MKRITTKIVLGLMLLSLLMTGQQASAVSAPSPPRTGWIIPTKEEVQRAKFVDFAAPRWQISELDPIVGYEGYVVHVYDQQYQDCVPCALGILKQVHQGLQFGGEWPQGLSGCPSPIYLYGQRANKSCGDCGMAIDDATNLIIRDGYAMQDVMKYNDGNPDQEPNQQQLNWGYPYRALEPVWLFWRDPGSSLIISINELKTFLSEDGPFTIGIPIFESFGSVNSSGQILLPQASETFWGLHQLPVIGYDDELESFIVVNSWGTDWGNDGYGHLPYDYLNNTVVRQYPRQGSAIVDSELDCEETPEGEPLPDFCTATSTNTPTVTPTVTSTSTPTPTNTPTPTPTSTSTGTKVYLPIVLKGKVNE